MYPTLFTNNFLIFKNLNLNVTELRATIDIYVNLQIT